MKYSDKVKNHILLNKYIQAEDLSDDDNSNHDLIANNMDMEESPMSRYRRNSHIFNTNINNFNNINVSVQSNAELKN